MTRHDNKFWPNVSFLWKNVKANNRRIPETLEENLDYNGKLFGRFRYDAKYGVIYNNGGEIYMPWSRHRMCRLTVKSTLYGASQR